MAHHSWQRLYELLGETCKLVFGTGKQYQMSVDDKKDLAAFYVEYLQNDVKRQREKELELQKRKEAALKKLTVDERKLLGLI
jgi:hypothetical protein